MYQVEKTTLEPPHRLILITGSVASGKTRLAQGINEVIVSTYFDKDPIADRYTPFRGEEYRRVRGLIHEELRQKTLAAVSKGETTIVEATLGDKRERGWDMPFRKIALAYGAIFVPILVVATESNMRLRMIERGYQRDLVRLAPEEWSRLMRENPREIDTLPADGLRIENNGDFMYTLREVLNFITKPLLPGRLVLNYT